MSVQYGVLEKGTNGEVVIEGKPYQRGQLFVTYPAPEHIQVYHLATGKPTVVLGRTHWSQLNNGDTGNPFASYDELIEFIRTGFFLTKGAGGGGAAVAGNNGDIQMNVGGVLGTHPGYTPPYETAFDGFGIYGDTLQIPTHIRMGRNNVLFMGPSASMGTAGNDWGMSVVNTCTINAASINLTAARGHISAPIFIGSTIATVPHPSLTLDVVHTERGSRPFPCMSQTQRLSIASPIQGLHVYQLDGTEGVYVYKSTGWQFAY